MRDVFAAIEGQLEMLRSDLVSLINLGGGPVSDGLRSAIGQLDQIILRLKRYCER